MNRRSFLKFNALSLASISSAYAMGDHSHHNMHSKHAQKDIKKNRYFFYQTRKSKH